MDFNYMKRRSIFDQPTPNTASGYPNFDFQKAADSQDAQDIQATPQATQPSKFSSTYSDLADEKGGPAFQKYNDFLNTASPSRDDEQFKPGKMQRLSAILAGVSEGVRHGGGAGYKTTQDILDEPYNQAQNDYKLQGDKLGTAAGIEEKDMGRRVGILKDIIAQEHNNRTADETERYHAGQLKNAADRNKRTGLHFTDITDPNTGLRKTFVIGPDAQKIGDIDLGKSALTPAEQVTEGAKKAGANFSATEPGRIRVAQAGAAARGAETRKTADAKFSNIKDLLKFKNENIKKYTFKNDPASGMVVGVNNSDPNDVITTSIEHGKLSDEDKASLGLKNAQTLKASPAATTTRTTKTEVSGNTKKSTTTTSSDNAGSKVKVIGPDGTAGTIDASELEEALKHGYKKR